MRSESINQAEQRMEKIRNFGFSKIKKLCEPCGNIQNNRKNQNFLKSENLVFRIDFRGRCPA